MTTVLIAIIIYAVVGIGVAIGVTVNAIDDCPCDMPGYHAAGGIALGAVWPVSAPLMLLGRMVVSLAYIVREVRR